MVDIPLARHVPRRDQLPHLLTCMDHTGTLRPRGGPHEDDLSRCLHGWKVRTPGSRGTHHAVLVRRLRGDGGVLAGQDLLWCRVRRGQGGYGVERGDVVGVDGQRGHQHHDDSEEEE